MSILTRNQKLRLHRNEPVSEATDLLAIYPDTSKLIQTLANKYEIPPECILITPGADGGIEVVCRATKGDVYLLEPDFGRYAYHAEMSGRKVRSVAVQTLSAPLDPRHFTKIGRDGPGLIILSTVGNPTNYHFPHSHFVEEIHRELPDKLILVDEVYSHFTGENYSKLASQTRGILSVGSVSKVGFAGARVGWVIGHPDTIGDITPFVSPVSVAGPSLEIVAEALNNPQYIRDIIQNQVSAREWVTAMLRVRGYSVDESRANWILVDLGEAALTVAQRLSERGVLVNVPEYRALRNYIRVSTPTVSAMKEFVAILTDLIEPPFTISADGLLTYKEGLTPSPGFMNTSFVTMLFNEVVVVDHYVLTFSTNTQLMEYAQSLMQHGGTIVEGPGIWPTDFCNGLEAFPQDLAMYFMTVQTPVGGLLVLAAPTQKHDQLFRFRYKRGPGGIHHVAILVSDLNTASRKWMQAGFMPMTPRPFVDGGLEQWFHKNAGGQIIEIMRRTNHGVATFTCDNILGLRLTEAQK